MTRTSIQHRHDFGGALRERAEGGSAFDDEMAQRAFGSVVVGGDIWTAEAGEEFFGMVANFLFDAPELQRIADSRNHKCPQPRKKHIVLRERLL